MSVLEDQLQLPVSGVIDNPFTPREQEVLELLVEGMSNIEIGQCLFLSPKTVKSHLTFMSRKIHAKNRTHLVVLALRQGFVELYPTVKEVT